MNKLIIILLLCPGIVFAQCGKPQTFTNGNVWKPVADHNPNLVVLLRSDYPKFGRCEVKKKNGSYEKMSYTGISNPDRYTYRGKRPGKSYAGKRKKGGVRCWKKRKACDFFIPGNPGRRHD